MSWYKNTPLPPSSCLLEWSIIPVLSILQYHMTSSCRIWSVNHIIFARCAIHATPVPRASVYITCDTKLHFNWMRVTARMVGIIKTPICVSIILIAFAHTHTHTMGPLIQAYMYTYILARHNNLSCTIKVLVHHVYVYACRWTKDRLTQIIHTYYAQLYMSYYSWHNLLVNYYYHNHTHTLFSEDEAHKLTEEVHMSLDKVLEAYMIIVLPWCIIISNRVKPIPNDGPSVVNITRWSSDVVCDWPNGVTRVEYSNTESVNGRYEFYIKRQRSVR